MAIFVAYSSAPSMRPALEVILVDVLELERKVSVDCSMFALSSIYPLFRAVIYLLSNEVGKPRWS